MPRWLALLFVLPQCTGCLYYAYPTLAHTPDLVIDNHDGGAHAFRVDIDRTERKPAATATEYTLSRIPIDTRGLVPSQLEVASASGVYNPLGIGDVKEHERSVYTMAIRLYRPGSQTMEVKEWDKSRPLQWMPAPDLESQERAVDYLLEDPERPDPARPNLIIATGVRTLLPDTWWQQKDRKTPPLGLQPGNVSFSQRKTLEFAASEYQRLASSPPALAANMATTRERLQQKAIWLQRFAVQPPTP